MVVNAPSLWRQFYRLHAWVIMTDHVHVIFQPHVTVSAIRQWLKGRSSRVANRIPGRTVLPFWQDESFDHRVRNSAELPDLIEYVEACPLKVGLVEAKEQWRWSSANEDRRQKPIVCPSPVTKTEAAERAVSDQTSGRRPA